MRDLILMNKEKKSERGVILHSSYSLKNDIKIVDLAYIFIRSYKQNK